MNLKGCNLELAHRNSQASIPFYVSSEPAEVVVSGCAEVSAGFCASRGGTGGEDRLGCGSRLGEVKSRNTQEKPIKKQLN